MKSSNWTLEGSAALVGIVGVSSAAISLLLTQSTDWPILLQIFIAVSFGYLFVLLSSKLFFSHIKDTVDMLESGLNCYKDGDFSIRLRHRPLAEFEQIIDIFNQLGGVLSTKHQDIFQRELLLQTIVSYSKMGIILRDSRDYIVLANPAAEQILGKKPLKAIHWFSLLDSADQNVKNAFESPDSRFG